MLQPDLENLSLKELRALHKDVEKAIATFEARKKSEARLKLEEMARDLGFTLSELAEQTAAKSRKPAVPRYANPANPAQTWTGRGRKPHWVIDALAQGKTLDDLKIGQ
jgi:DNA-binding protein H-NS